jgi:hypothetical protein
MGRAALTVAAFPEQEFGGKEGKSVSVLRPMTEVEELTRRATGRNREPAWQNDPVVARGSVGPLRSLRDHTGRREICVNADPLTDDLGFCRTHSSILRSDPPPDRSQRMQRAKLRLALVTIFSDVFHLSGRALADWGI